jgi:hypothetical protein
MLQLALSHLEGSVLDEVNVWLPDVAMVVQRVQGRVPGGPSQGINAVSICQSVRQLVHSEVCIFLKL